MRVWIYIFTPKIWGIGNYADNYIGSNILSRNIKVILPLKKLKINKNTFKKEKKTTGNARAQVCSTLVRPI